MSDLKPCPFCGCTTIKRVEHINGVVHHCNLCDATGPFEGVFDGVKQGWNTRTLPAADRIEALSSAARVRPMAWVQSMHFPAVSVAWCPVLEKHFYAEKPGDRERVEAKRAARILSAVITGQEKHDPISQR